MSRWPGAARGTYPTLHPTIPSFHSEFTSLFHRLRPGGHTELLKRIKEEEETGFDRPSHTANISEQLEEDAPSKVSLNLSAKSV